MADLTASVVSLALENVNEILSFALAVPPTYSYNHRITGTVKVNGVVAQKMVMIFNRENMDMLAIKSSQADGTFEFIGLPESRLPIHANGILVLAIDSKEGFNAKVADKIEPVGIGEAI